MILNFLAAHPMQHALLNENFGDVQTVIVIGAGRGGTSVIAGCLRGLGVCMGADAHMFKHEWSPVVRTSEDQVDLAATCETIEMMDREHKLWGWKSPRDAFVLEQIFPFLRAPGLLVVTRDLSDVAHSAGKHQSVPFEIALRETAQVYQLIADRLRFWPWPTLVVGFEEVLQHANDFVNLVCAFLKLESSPAEKERVASFIDPKGKAYRRFDWGYNEGPDDIPPDHLVMDADRAAAHFIEQYSRQYIFSFDAILEDTKRACEILEKFSAPENSRGFANVLEKMHALLEHFAEKDFLSLGLDFSAADSSASEAKTQLEAWCDRLAGAAHEIGQRLTSTDASPESYDDLAKLHQLLLIMIRLRTALQRALHLHSGNR